MYSLMFNLWNTLCLNACHYQSWNLFTYLYFGLLEVNFCPTYRAKHPKTHTNQYIYICTFSFGFLLWNPLIIVWWVSWCTRRQAMCYAVILNLKRFCRGKDSVTQQICLYVCACVSIYVCMFGCVCVLFCPKMSRDARIYSVMYECVHVV